MNCKLNSLFLVVISILTISLNGQHCENFNQIGNCTSIVVSKGASVDGSVMTTHSCDGYYDFRLSVVSGKIHKKGAKRKIYKGNGHIYSNPVYTGEIPESEKTYSRFEIAYPFMNEKQVAIGESTFGGRRELRSEKGMFDVIMLERIALERASTAREAIKIMGSLATKYGYSDGGECLTVCDTEEAWMFEILGPGEGKLGAVWAAVRVPDGYITVNANLSRIGELDLDDKENYLASDNVVSLAVENGWYDPNSGKEFRFKDAYDPTPPWWLMCTRREWRVLSTLAPSLNLDPWAKEYPLFVKPDKKVSVQDLMALHRDTFEGTKFDQTKGLDAGPFKNPNRWSTPSSVFEVPEGYMGWERPIAVARCSYSFVSQSRNWLPDWIGGLIWFGLDDPRTTCYIPIYCGVKEVPESYSIGNRKEFDRDCAWWAFDFVNNFANVKWCFMIEDIRNVQARYETGFFENQPIVEKRAQDLYKESPEQARKYLNDYSYTIAQRVVDEWWNLSDYLIVKYNDGYINIPERKAVGYPKEWLEAVGYGTKKIEKPKR